MKKIILSVMLIASLIMLSGCNNDKDNIENDSAINIVTSFYPMYIATSNIVNGVDSVSLKCLAAPTTGCLHDYQLTVNDMITLETADVFVINGGDMESFMDKAISAYPELSIINASANILEEDTYDEHDIHIEDDGEHEHADEENPHVWVSISNYIKQVENICDALKEYNPENAELYENNKNSYIEQLENLKTEMHEKLDNLPNRNIVTFHEAFYYFAEEFNLNVVAVIEREPGTSPSAGEIAQIIEKVKSEDVNAIFTEPQYSKTAADTISMETGIEIFELDPVVTGELDKDAYINIMKKNLDILLEALK